MFELNQVHARCIQHGFNDGGLVMVVNLALGTITPPFGVNLFAACTVARISLDRIIPYLLPFVLVVLGCLMVITYVPELSLFLRDMVYKK
jgi:TRAP-type C4-dicarboxylate transport system permease large subunit